MTLQSIAPAFPNVADYQQVALALQPRHMQPYLAAGNAGQVPCHILDAKYEPGQHCSILYQLGERLLIGELQWQETANVTSEMAASLQPSVMQIYPFEDDPALANLTTVLDGQKMAQILFDNLRIAGSLAFINDATRILRCQVTPLRYRLGKRCTLRFDLWLRDGERGAISKRTLYGKLYHSVSKAQAVYDEMQMLAAAPALRMGGVTVAQAVAFVPTLPMVFQAPVRGMPLDLLLSQPKRTALAHNAQTRTGIRGAAAALAALHKVEGSTNRLRPVAAELERFQRRSAKIMAVDPIVGGSLYELACALPAWLDQLPVWGAENTLVHGDCKPSQFFIDQAATGEVTVALLDFDHCGMADPAADVGNFLATLRQLGIVQGLTQREPTMVAHLQQGLATLETEFLSAYLAARPCHPGFRARAAWYQAVALLRKALRSFARSPRSPLPALLVQAAWRCLEQVKE